MLKIQCKFSISDRYSVTCDVNTQYIPEDKVVRKYDGELPLNCLNSNVHYLHFKDCIIPRIPYGLSVHFQNTIKLSMNNCRLSKICKDDLKGFTALHTLNLSNNQLRFLPGDLFKYTPSLKCFDCSDNKIEFIEPEMFDCFQHFTEGKFRNNKAICRCFNNGRYSFENFKTFLKETFVKRNEHQEVLDENEKLAEENERLTALNEELVEKYEKGISDDINALLENEELKDFVIKVGESEFKVHKFILIARSSTFAEMIKNNPDADNMELKDISENAFKEILEFIYTDEEPSEEADMKEIFGAADKLKIEKLKEIAARKLIEGLNSKNAYEFLVLGHKYEHEELKLKSFEEIKNIIPKLKDGMIKEHEKLKVLIDAWRNLEEVED